MPARGFRKDIMLNVEVRGEDECWPWLGCVDRRGYGKASDGPRKRTAHRVVYERMVGPVPEGWDVDHSCDNPTCCNYLKHLRPMTHQENSTRGAGFAAENARKTHCPAGHEYTPENTSMINHGRSRRCKTCINERERRKRRERREAAR